MPYFKDKHDGFYIYEKYINDDLIEITEAEYALANTPPAKTITERKAEKQREIDALESSWFMTRGEREGWLAMIEAQASAQSVPLETLYLANPFYKKLKDANTQITALRAELKAIA